MENRRVIPVDGEIEHNNISEGGVQTEPISRKPPVTMRFGINTDDDDFVFEESERQVRIREAWDEDGARFLIKE